MSYKVFRLMLVLELITTNLLLGQNSYSVWCFGDSALVDFNDTANIVAGESIINSRGSCATICDSLGQLLFYSGYDDDVYTIGGPPFNQGEVFNKQHQTMQNGDSIVMGLWYHEVIIINDPASPNKYYAFSIGVTGNFGLYYSKIDMTANGGLGAVIQKNVQLLVDRQGDCISAVKHGNGRDWWILGRSHIISSPTNEYWRCLVTPTGVSPPVTQNIGSLNKSDASDISFSPTGDTLLFTNGNDLIEYYNFNRCTGLLSNPITIRPPATTYSEWTWDNEFSPNGRYIYTSTSKDTTQLFQYDLQSPNPLANRVTLYQSTFPSYCGGALKRAPDGKIYFSIAYENVVAAYPYPDSIYNMYNMNLSVINQPDSPGVACDFQPYSFYLGGKRTYWGLPNNPDYDMPRDSGSVCDTIQWTGVNEQEAKGHGQLYVSYVTDWQKAFINAQHLKGATYTLSVIDITGRIIYEERSGQRPSGSGVRGGYFTKDLDCSAFNSGLYIVTLTTNKEQLSQKFIKE